MLSSMNGISTRPSESASFKPQGTVSLLSNKYRINFTSKKGSQIICKYDISFEPAVEKDSRDVISEKIKLFTNNIKETLGIFL